MSGEEPKEEGKPHKFRRHCDGTDPDHCEAEQPPHHRAPGPGGRKQRPHAVPGEDRAARHDRGGGRCPVSDGANHADGGEE